MNRGAVNARPWVRRKASNGATGTSRQVRKRSMDCGVQRGGQSAAKHDAEALRARVTRRRSSFANGSSVLSVRVSIAFASILALPRASFYV